MSNVLLSAAAASAQLPGSPGIEPGILRFALLYHGPIDPDRARAAVTAFVGSGNYVLRRPPNSDDDFLLLLEFPGVPRQQSAEFLFQTSHEIADALDLAACTPDVDPVWIGGDEQARDAPESVGGLVSALCNSSASKPTDKRWSLQQVKAPQAWARFNTRGVGILIGQPDTGVADHRELDGALDIARGIDLVAGSGPPIDPLAASMGNPGHGTATAGCVVGTAAGQIGGVAPEAKIVPLRCIDTVVIGAGASVAAAIDHGRKQGCHIITMSLGGPLEFPELRRAIERAVAANMIVLAASGNCVGIVVYPAWDKNVIAVGGVDQNRRRWKGSSRGGKVDFCAPAENVFVAERTKPTDADLSLVMPGQGTSYAVAHAAGCAALWLSHHGPATIAQIAAQKGVTVQELFRAAARRTAQPGPNWPGNLGTGILDAERLLELDLSALGVMASVESAHPADSLLESGLDHDRFAAETGFLRFDRDLRRNPSRSLAMESSIVPLPSPQLREALERAGRSRAFTTRTRLAGSPLSKVETTPEALRILAKGQGGAQSEATIESARAHLADGGATEMTELLRAELGSLSNDADPDPKTGTVRDRVLDVADKALANLVAGATPDQLPMGQRFAVEAMILMTGRPALRLRGGAIDSSDPQLGDWGGTLIPQRAALNQIYAAVGRIDIELSDRWVHAGTGTLLKGGLIMTNRHVMEAFAEPIPAAGAQGFLMTYKARINFSDEASDPTHSFAITGVVGAGRERISRAASVVKLDMALLTVESSNGTRSLPNPVAPFAGLVGHGDELVVIGYPAKPDTSAATDPRTGRPSEAMWDRLWEIFQNRYGVKYVSPGTVMEAPGALSGDPRKWGFSHDATTLPGNSGSAIASLSGAQMFGLHFAGAPLRQNLAHDIAAVRSAGAAAGIDPALFDAMF